MPRISVTLKGYNNGNDLKLVYPEGVTEQQIASDIKANAPDLPAEFVKFDFIPSSQDFRDIGKQALQVQKANLDANPIQEGMEPGGTIKKSALSFAAEAAAGTGYLLESLPSMVEGMVNKPRDIVGRIVHGKDRFSKLKKDLPEWNPELSKKISRAISQPFIEGGKALRTISQAVEGNDAVSGIAGAAGSLVPVAAAAPVPGGGIFASGAVSYGSARDEARDYMLKLGVDPAEAEDMADKVGWIAGLSTAAITKYVPEIGKKIPGVGKLMGEGVEGWTKRVLSTGLKDNTATSALMKEIAAASFGEATEEAIDQVAQSVIARKTYRPDLTWEQAAKEVGMAFAAGGVVGGGTRGIGVGGQLLTGAKRKAEEADDRAREYLESIPTTQDIGNGRLSVQYIGPDNRAVDFEGTPIEIYNQLVAQSKQDARPMLGNIPVPEGQFDAGYGEFRADAQDQIPTVEIDQTPEPSMPVEPSMDAAPEIETQTPRSKPMQARQATAEDFQAGAKPMRARPAVPGEFDEPANKPVPATPEPEQKEPAPEPEDTRGKGVQYHGSRKPIESIGESYYSPNSYYGQGFYTTDSTDIARGYAGLKKGNKSGKVYQVAKKKDTKLYDMEQPMDESVVEMIKGIENDLFDEALAENPKNLREFYDAVRDWSREYGYSKDSVQELFDTIGENLQHQGYDGLRHIGGLRTGKAPHNVEIYFKPWEVLELSEPGSKPDLPTEPQAPAEPAVEPISEPTERGGATQQPVGNTPGNKAEQIQSAPTISEEQKSTSGHWLNDLPEKQRNKVDEYVEQIEKLANRYTEDSILGKVDRAGFGEYARVLQQGFRPDYARRLAIKKAQSIHDELAGAGLRIDESTYNRLTEKLNESAQKPEQQWDIERWRLEVANPVATPKTERTNPEFTPKEARAQKKYLIDAIDEAIQSAPDENIARDSVTIEVPGDGVFTLGNDKKTLKKFKETASKRFPSAPVKQADPKLPTKKSTRPAAVDSAPDSKKAGKVAGSRVSEDPNRNAIQFVKAEGDHLVATDGRRLIRIISQTEGSPESPVLLDRNGSQTSELDPNEYPDYAQVVPEKRDIVFGGVNTEELFKIARQALIATKSDSKNAKPVPVVLYVNPDGTVGADAGSDTTDGAYSHNLQPGAKPFTSIDPELLVDAMNASRALGSKTVDLYSTETFTGPIVVKGAIHEEVIAPLFIDKEWALKQNHPVNLKAKPTHSSSLPVSPRPKVASKIKSEPQSKRRSRKAQGKGPIQLDLDETLQPEITATGIEGIRQAVEQSDLPEYTKSVIRAMLESPALRDLAWDNLTLNLVADNEDGFQGAADLGKMLIEMSRQASPDTFAHEVFHFLYELMPENYRNQIERLRRNEIERMLQGTDDPVKRALLKQLLEGDISSMEWSRMGYDPELYHLRSGSEFMSTMFGERFAKEVFFRRGESPAKRVASKIKEWLTALLDAIKRVVGIDPSINRIYRELLAGKHKLTPEAGARFEEVHGSLAPVATPKDYKLATDFDPLMDPADAEFERRAYWVENAAAVWPVSDKVGQMDAAVAKEIPELIDRVKTLTKAGGEIGWGNLPRVADLQTAIEQMAGETHEKARLAFGALANIANLYDAKNGLTERIKETEDKIKIATKRDAEQQKRDIATTIVERITNSERKSLLPQREAAQKAGNSDLVRQINAKMEWTRERQEAMRRTVLAIAKHLKLKPAALADSGVVDLWRTFREKNDPEMYITPDVVSEVERLLSQINEYIPASQVKVLESKLESQRKALEFLQKEVLEDPQVLKNFDYAANASGESRATILRQQQGKGQHDIIYTNPLNTSERVSVRPGFDKKTYEDNFRALTTAAQWFRASIEDPKTDPLQREAHKHELYQIENVHLNQHYNPEVGKLVVSDASAFVDPWTFAMRMFQGVMDVPEYALNMVGGRHGKEAFAALTNYSNFMERIKDVKALHQREPQVKAIEAAKKHGLAKGSWDVNGVLKWQREIGDEILGSYQNRGDVRYKTGMKIRGRKITKEDMIAVRAQKRYIDEIIKAMETLEQGTEFMRRDPVRIRDVVGRVVIDRRGLDTSGLTVPQRLRGIAMRFADDWKSIREKLRLDMNNAPDDEAKAEIERMAVEDYARLMSDEKYWDAVLSHIESYSNPAYAADNKTPFKGEYRAMAFERMESGMAPANFDMLVKTIFEMQYSKDVDEQMSEEEIAKQIIREIGKTVRAFSDNESSSTPLVDTKPDINIIHAENWANRPRGKRILPRGFYEYAVSTSDDMNNVSSAYVEVLAQRYLNKLAELRDALEADLNEFRDLVSRGISSEAEIRKNQIDGKHFLNLRELEIMVPMVNRQLSAMQQWANHMQEIERDSFSSINIWRGAIVNSLLQKADTLIRNLFGPGARWHQLDRMMLSSARNIFLNNPIVGVGVSTLKSMQNMGRTVVSGLTRLLASPILNTEAGQTALAQLKKSPDYWAKIASYWLHKIQVRNSEIERDKALGIINPDPWKEAIKSYVQMAATGGRLQKDNQTRWAQSVVGLATETGSLLMLPRALGANAMDRAVNAQAGWYSESVIQPLKRGAMAYEERVKLGYDPTRTVLTPEEVYGSKRGDEESLAFMREVFDNAGINLDKTLIEFWQKASEAKKRGEPVEDIPLLTEPQLNSLRMEIAKKINKPTFANRPIYKNKAQSFLMTFLGYPIWQNAEISKWQAGFSRGNKSKAKTNLRALMITSEVMFSHILNGLISGSIGAFLVWLLYRERKYAKKWSVAAAGGAWDVVETAMEKSASQLPLIGNLINYGVFKTVGAGGRFAYGGFSLLPISFVESVMSTIARTITTQDIARPWIEWVRAYFPQSRILANRLPITEGITRQREGRAIIASNRPPDVDLKAFSGNVQYSPFSDEYDQVANLLYKPGTPDWATISQVRNEVAKQKLADKKSSGDSYSLEKAMRDFDSAIISGRSPYTVLGREMTQDQRNQFLNNLSRYDLETVRDLENRLKAYARHFGRAEPDFVRQNAESKSNARPKLKTDYRRSVTKMMGVR